MFLKDRIWIPIWPKKNSKEIMGGYYDIIPLVY